MIKIFQISLREFLTKKFILLSTLPLIVSVLILGGFLIFGGIEFFSMLNDGAKSGDFSFIDEAQYPLLTSILAFALTKWLIIAIFYMIGVFFVVIISVVIALIVAGFLTPIVTNHLNQKYYHYHRFEEISFLKSLKLMMIVLLKVCLFLLISIPFLFIPLINLIVVNIPFFYLYYKFMLLDVGSNALNKNDFEILWLRDGGNDFKLSCLVFYIVSLVPFLGLFLQLFFVIFLSNLIYKKHN
ncbi:EI24 domain-containing protein [Campylobacter sputorum]|uniref:EI24 domain-containing protein n=1 Tax=Campylobacter sputorum TaxID=206 RepID=UPI001E575ADA|nr:EI24 domain-containing protein [Campylobacter sputorum]